VKPVNFSKDLPFARVINRDAGHFFDISLVMRKKVPISLWTWKIPYNQ
jgi:hypothetical protein